jgi:hypothetical protein
VPVLAHHTVAGVYDPGKRATLNGVVSDVEWKQPHIVVHMDVKDDSGHWIAWAVEAQAPLIMRSHGLMQDSLKPGVSVSSTVCLARDGSHRGYAQTFTVPERGTVLSLGCNSPRSTP